MWYYKVWFINLRIFFKTNFINSEFMRYFHTFYHKALLFLHYFSQINRLIAIRDCWLMCLWHG